MTEPTYIGPIEEEKENEPKYLGETTQEELVTPWSARYPHLAAIPSTLKELPSEVKRTFTGELPISPREGLYDIPKKPWYERIPEIAVEQIPFREQILGTKEWRTPETMMEAVSLYGAGKFLGEAGGAFKRGFPKVAEALTKQRLFPWQKPIAPTKPMISGMEGELPIRPKILPPTPEVRPTSTTKMVELRHYTEADITKATRPDANGLIWFTEGESYLKGPPKKPGKWGYVTENIPENKILRIDETPGVLEEYLASPFGKSGRSKVNEMAFAESKGYLAVKRGEDVAIRATKIKPTPEEEAVVDSLIAKGNALPHEKEKLLKQLTEPRVGEIKPKTKIGVQRVEEKGIEIDFEKPQGLYLSPEELKSPHITEGGITEVFNWNPENPLDVSGSLMVKTATRKTPSGAPVEASAGIKALKQLVGDQEFDRLIGLKKPEMLSELTKKYPNVNWNKYTDTYEMMEGIAGIEARTKGYDAIVDIDKINPEFSEYVALNKKVILPEAKVEVPVTPETLEAQVKGGPTGPFPKYAGTEEGIQASAINLERLNTPDDVKHFLDGFTKTIEEKIGRRKYSWEEIEDIGTELGWDLKKAKSQLGRLTGGELSAKIDAMRQLNATVVTDFHNKLIQLPVDPLQRTPAMKMQLREDLRKVTNSVSITSEIASEAGRALGIHRKEVGYNKLYNKIIGTIDEIYGTKELPDDLINKLQALDPNKAGELAGFLIKISKAKTMDHINRIWYDIILSNPPTHGANFIGNTLRFGWKYPEKTITAGLETVRGLVTGKPRERFFGEVPRDAFAIFSGIKDGVRAGMKTLKTGIPPEMGTKLDVPRMAQTQVPLGWGLPGKVIEAIRPTTMLGVADDMAKGVIYETEMSGLAYRQAKIEGLKGRAKDLRIQEIKNSPPEELANRAWKSAVEMTFQQKVGKIGNYVMRIRDVNIPGTNIKPLIFLIPFIRTGINIAKFTAQTTPVNILWVGYKVVKGMISGPEISEQLARSFLGTMIATATYILAKSGYLTGGGPKSKTERDEKLRTGWQPYSWNIGNKYYGYGRTEPIGSLWGMVADFADSEAQMTKDGKTNYFESIVKSTSKNITSKTWWQGATRALDATSDPEHYGKAFVEGLAGTFIPSVSGGIARAIDPYFREPQGIVDVWKSKIPGLSQEVLPKINTWGEPIERPSTPAMRFISPIQISEERGTPIDYELKKLKLNLGMPSKKIKVKGYQEVELEPNEYQKMVANGGQRAKTELNKLVTKPEFKNLGEEEKTRKIRAINDRHRESVKQSTIRKIRSEGRLIREFYIPLESRQEGGEVKPLFPRPVTEMNLSNALKEWEKATPEEQLKMSPYIMKKFQESRSQSKVNR